MAVPIVFNVIPSRGPTTGRSGVHIYGDAFRLPTVDWSAPGIAPTVGPTVRVFFGDTACSNVRVLRSNHLFVLAPPTPIADVTLRMLGSPTVTFANVSPATVTRSAGSWLSDGFRSGQYITIAKSTSNNGTFKVDVASASTLTLSATATLVDEGPTSGVEIESHAYGEGKVDVTIRNCDDDGDSIPGETVVVADAYTYSRVQLATETNLARLVRKLIRELRKQIIPNVMLGVNTEYDQSTGDRMSLVMLAALPGIALNGPVLSEDRFFSLNGMVTTISEDGTVELRPAPYTVDLTFDMIGVSDSQVELLNLMALATQVIDRNPYLYLDRVDGNPGAGQVRYEFDFAAGGDFQTAANENTSNIRSFSGSVVVRGVDLEDLAGFAGESIVEVTQVVEEIVTSLDQTGESYDVGPSPGG